MSYVSALDVLDSWFSPGSVQELRKVGWRRVHLSFLNMGLNKTPRPRLLLPACIWLVCSSSATCYCCCTTAFSLVGPSFLLYKSPGRASFKACAKAAALPLLCRYGFGRLNLSCSLSVTMRIIGGGFRWVLIIDLLLLTSLSMSSIVAAALFLELSPSSLSSFWCTPLKVYVIPYST